MNNPVQAERSSGVSVRLRREENVQNPAKCPTRQHPRLRQTALLCAGICTTLFCSLFLLQICFLKNYCHFLCQLKKRLYLCSIQKRKRFGGGALIGSLVTKRFLFLYGIYFVYTVLYVSAVTLYSEC